MGILVSTFISDSVGPFFLQKTKLNEKKCEKAFNFKDNPFSNVNCLA